MSNQARLQGSTNKQGVTNGSILGSLVGTFTLIQNLNGAFNAVFNYTDTIGPTGNISTPILVLAGGSITPSGGSVTANHLASGTIVDGGTY